MATISIEVPEGLTFRTLHLRFSQERQRLEYEIYFANEYDRNPYYKDCYVGPGDRWGNARHEDLRVAIALAAQEAKARASLARSNINRKLEAGAEPHRQPEVPTKVSAADILGLLGLDSA